jgi:hypothetical protein
MTTATAERIIRYEPKGAILDLFNARDPEILVVGPAGTGKTYGVLQLIHLLCLNHPGMRALICRKTLVSLTGTALTTLREKVLTPDDPVKFFGGSHAEPASFRYANGSRIVVGGMDSPSKILSSEYDLAYVNEATECSEEDIETLTTRLRNGVLRYPRLLMDCNPSYERHHLLKRCQRGQTRMIKSTHTDNPTITDDYLTTLERLSGTRRQRLYVGEWVGMENAIYGDLLDPMRLLIPIPDRIAWQGAKVGGMDYGRIHLSAVVAITQSSDGTYWVRECWAEPGGSKEQIMQAVRSHGTRYGVHRGVTDPIQEWAAQDLGWTPAKSGAGSRKGRIERVRGLLETDAIRFDVYGPGVQELWDEMQMYRYEVRETDTVIEDVVVRKDDDRVAAFEYAIEALNGGIEYDYVTKNTARRAPLPQRSPSPMGI